MVLLKIVIVVALIMMSATAYGTSKFQDEFEPTFGDKRVQTYGPNLMSLNLDKWSGSGFRSKKEYLFGRVDVQMKLVAGDSAGTVTTLYLSSDQSTGHHDEIDFEFLGNVSGQPYTVHTNVFSQGKGSREQQFRLWFDPTKNFHTYSIVWNKKHIILLIDEVPIRMFKSSEDLGVPFPKNQPMRLYSSLWNADDWATQGGRVKTDWSKAPFRAYYRNFNIDACVATDSSCPDAAPTHSFTDSTHPQNSPNARAVRGSWRTRELDGNDKKRLRWVQKNFMIYDYCNDSKRFSEGYPAECKRSRV